MFKKLQTGKGGKTNNNNKKETKEAADGYLWGPQIYNEGFG